MIVEALRWYAESLTAFWVSLSHGGLLRLILICCLIYWIYFRRKHWGCRCRCSHCGCRCGHCSCGAEDEGDEGAGDDEGGEAADATV